MKQKSIIITAAVLLAIGITTVGAVSANAYYGKGQYHDEMVKKLSEKLGVDSSKVDSVLSELRVEHHQKMEAQFADRVNRALTNGTITGAQKNAILAKQDEFEKKREANQEAFQNMTPDERRTARESERSALESWATSQGIDLKDFFGGHKGFKMGIGRGMMQ